MTFIPGVPLTTSDLSERIDALGLARLKIEILQRSVTALRLIPGRASDGSFFGEAALKPSERPPSSATLGPLSCVLCVRLQDIAQQAAANGLPRSGWLVFWLALPDGLSLGDGPPFDGDASAVTYFDESIALSPTSGPFEGEFQHVAFEPFQSLPDPQIARQLWSLSAAESEAYETLFLPQNGVSLGPPPHALHYMFGHAAPLTTSALPDPDQPVRTLLLQLKLHEAIGTELLSRPQVSFFTERDRPLETLEVIVE